jgi:two-component system C4-dicarboxylate transport response regulator DctD
MTGGEEPVLDIDVLVVDDDAEVRASEADVLRTAGYCVIEASDVASAWERLQFATVKSVVLDVYMAGLSGLWLLDQLDDPPPVLLVTGHDLDPDVLARKEKFVTYLQKPVSPRVLLDAVAVALSAAQKESGP